MTIGKHLRAKGSAHRSTLSAVSLLLLGVGGMLLPVSEANARCSNVVYSLDIPDKFNLIGKNVGDILGYITSTYAGTCKKNPGSYGVIVASKQQLPSTAGPINTSKGYDSYDMTNTVSIGNSPGENLQGIVWKESSASGNVDIGGSHGIPIVLRKKTPGKVSIPVNQFYTNRDFYFVDMRSVYPITNAVIGTGNFNSSIELSYTPTCSASVDDVVFPGTPTASAIAAGTVTPRTATVNVSCDDILPKYTIKVSSPNGTQGNAMDGVIKSNNASVGYSLSWKEGQVAAIGSPIQLDSVLTPATLPTQSTFNLPISVKPVALVPLANVMAGPANSAIKIDLTFN